MKAKFVAFGFMAGFKEVPKEATRAGYNMAIMPRVTVSAMMGSYPVPHLKIGRFEFVGYDQDNAAIFELIEIR